MAKCQDLELLLAMYVDGEAAPEQRASVDAHISRCPPCRVLVEEQRAAREIIASRRQGLRACAPERLRARCAAHRAAQGTSDAARANPAVAPRTVHSARRTSKRLRGASVKWLSLSLAATLLLAVGGLFLYSGLNQVEALAAQLAVDHVKCAKFASAPQDPVAAASRWAAATGWTVQVPASAPDRDLEFISLRRCLVTEGRTAHLMYRWRGEPLSLFVVPDTLPDGNGDQRTVDKFGHEAVMWSANDRTYVVLARGRPLEQEIRPVVGYMKAHVR